MTPSRRILRRRVALGAAAATLCLAGACSGGGDETAESSDTSETSESPETSSVPTGTIEPVDTEPGTTAEPYVPPASTTTIVAPTTSVTATTVPATPRVPLTGKPLASGEKAPDRPAMVVKIDNVGAARPQTGLNQADIVFEEIVEGRATRFAAVFHSQGANPVGPIRSGRSQDIDLLSGLNQPIFVWSGGNHGVVRVIEESDFYTLNATGRPPATGFFRSSDRPAPHNLYSNTDPYWVQLTWALGRPEPVFTYVEPGEAVPGTAASFVQMNVGGNRIRWDYDAGSGLYMRQQNGSPHRLTDGQASADNVVVLVTNYRPSSIDTRSPEAITVGTGFAFVYSDGKYQEGIWSRKDNRAPITLVTRDGDPIDIAPGRTWVELADAVDHDIAYG